MGQSVEKAKTAAAGEDVAPGYDFTVCKVCGSQARPRYALKYPSRPSWIYQCANCNLHYLDYLDDGAESESESVELGEDDYAYIEYGLQSSAERFAWQLDFVSRNLDLNSARILDIGAGGGMFLALVRDRGAIPLGVEPAKERRIFAQQRYGLDLQPHLIASPYWQEGYVASVDGVCLWDVIEHVNFPKDVLRHAVNVLKPGGKIFIETPTRESLFYKMGELSYRITGGQYPFLLKSMYYSPNRFAHKQIFTRRQITDILKKLEMRIVHVETFHELSFPINFYLRRLVGSKVIVDLATPLVRYSNKIFLIRNKMLVAAERGRTLQAR